MQARARAAVRSFVEQWLACIFVAIAWPISLWLLAIDARPEIAYSLLIAGAVIILFWRSQVSNAVTRIAAFDLDATAAQLPTDEQHDAHGTLTFLIGFAFTAAGLLGFAAQGRGQQVALVVIYCAVGVLQISGVVHILRSTEIQGISLFRVYDVPTIRFGRWALVVITSLSVSFAFLALFGLIPGQEPERKVFEGPLKTTPELLSTWLKQYSNPGQSARRNVESAQVWWLNELQARWSKEHPGQQRLVVIEQDTPFLDDYQSFAARIAFDADDYNIVGGVFALRAGDSSRLFEGRQLHLDRQVGNAIQHTNRIKIEDPNTGERLMFVVAIGRVGEKDLPSDFDVENLGLRLELEQ